jgi:hypothetical protein
MIYQKYHSIQAINIEVLFHLKKKRGKINLGINQNQTQNK